MPTRPKTPTPEERQLMAAQTAAEERSKREQEGTFVSPTRAGSTEPPLMDEDSEQGAALEDQAEAEAIAAFEHDEGIWSEVARALLPKPKGLHAKLTEVIQEVAYIQKTGTAPTAMGGYKFVEAGNIAAKLRMALATRGVTMLPEYIEQVGDVIHHTTQRGGTLFIQTIKTTWRLTDSETGESTVIQSMGTGGDNGDKFSPKAQTNAMKYALQVGFLLETGDDPEKFDLSEPEQGPGIQINASNVPGVIQGGRQNQATTVQLDAIRARARELELSPEGLAVLIASALGGKTPDIDNLETKDAQRVILDFLGELSFNECGAVVSALDNTLTPLEHALAPEDVGAK